MLNAGTKMDNQQLLGIVIDILFNKFSGRRTLLDYDYIEKGSFFFMWIYFIS